MTQSNGTLARLRRERDQALSKTQNHLSDARQCVKSFDRDVETLTTNHPFLALGGAVAVGAAAGLLIGGQPIRFLAKATALAIVKPVSDGVAHKIMETLGG